MNTIYKSEQSKRFTLRTPLNSTNLRNSLPQDAEILFADIVSVRIGHTNGKEYRLKSGYRYRAMPGAQFASSILAEDFLSEGKRIPGSFELAISFSLSPDGFIVSASAVVDKDPQQEVRVQAIEVLVCYKSTQFAYNGTDIPGSVPTLELAAPMVGMKISNVNYSDAGEGVVEVEGLDHPITLPRDVVDTVSLLVGDWLIITQRNNAVVITEEQFIALFKTPVATPHFPELTGIEQQLENLHR